MSRSILFVCLLCFAVLRAQQLNVVFQFDDIGAEAAHLHGFDKVKESNIEKALGVWLNEKYVKGYIEASVDSFIQIEKVLYVYAHLGMRYSYAIPDLVNLDPEELMDRSIGKAGRQEWSFEKIEALMNETLKAYESGGYPFAEISLANVELVGSEVNLALITVPNDLITWDTIQIEGNSGIKQFYLQDYLDILPGQGYDPAKVSKIPDRLEQLIFLRLAATPEVIIENGRAKLTLVLEKQKSNRFDLLLGFLPNDQLSDRKITIIGNGKLLLRNSFGWGEEIDVDFAQNRPRTQDLKIGAALPYLYTFPLGLQGAFDLYKNDTSFIRLNGQASITYQFGGFNSVSAFYEGESSNVLNYDTSEIKQLMQLPDELDYRSGAYGLGIRLQDLEYPLVPRKGFYLELRAMIGTKRVRSNANITNLTSQDGFDFASLYNELGGRRLQTGLLLNYGRFIKLSQKNILMLRTLNEFLITKNVLSNEAFRVGGFSSLRGFDEESILSPFYSINTLEYRYLLSQNSFFHTFFDWGVVQDIRSNEIQQPFGFGAGVSLETGGGIFSLSYALGKSPNDPLQFRNGKIHFGYLNLF